MYNMYMHMHMRMLLLIPYVNRERQQHRELGWVPIAHYTTSTFASILLDCRVVHPLSSVLIQETSTPLQMKKRRDSQVARQVCDRNLWLSTIVLSPHHQQHQRLTTAAACHLLFASGFRWGAHQHLHYAPLCPHDI